MAARGMVCSYRPLLRTTYAVPRLPRRTISYTRPLRADEDGSKTNSVVARKIVEAADKKVNAAASKPDGEASKTTPEQDPQQDPNSTNPLLSAIKSIFFPSSQEAKKPNKPLKAPQFQRQGSLGADSIFADEGDAHELPPLGDADAGPSQGPVQEQREIPPLERRNKHTMNATLDPDPRARKQWERKMIIKEIRKRGRLTKKEVIMATERKAVVRSHWFKTSVKKLVPLARQIQGKSVDEAILQMRFSKKKVAKDVMEHLEYARNIAIVRHGMGLEHNDKESKIQPVTITLKNGESKTITNPSAIYIAEAWVNRGPFGIDYDHRARGKINLLRPPHTALSVVLKEEKTQIREWKVREARALRQRKSMLWVQLPNRPISAQNQYYSW